MIYPVQTPLKKLIILLDILDKNILYQKNELIIIYLF